MNIVEIYKKFPTEAHCIAYLEQIRRGGVPKCPYCNSINSTPMPRENRHHCNRCNMSFSVTVGTIFHDTRLDLQKWFLAITLILNAKKGISARQLARDLGVSKDTAWLISMKIRGAMLQERTLFTGIVEMDETYVGGKPRAGDNKRGRGTNKTPVVGMVQRNGKVSAKTSKGVTAKHLSQMVREKVDLKNATVMTDFYPGYNRLCKFVDHKKINHSIKQYVCGDIHTNTIEGFWSLLKRGIIGQYHKVSVRYLQRYIDEFCYKYNTKDQKCGFDHFLLLSVTK